MGLEAVGLETVDLVIEDEALVAKAGALTAAGASAVEVLAAEAVDFVEVAINI